MKPRGYTLIELMVGLIIFFVVMAALLSAFSILWKADSATANMANNQLGAKEIVVKMAESFRGAAICASTDSGCELNSPQESASTNTVTLYSRNSSGTLVKTVYSTSSGSFTMTTGSTVTTLASNATMTLTYYSSSTYYATALTTFTPSSTTDSTVIAVQIAVTCGTGTTADAYTTLVRLNGGP